MGGQQLRGEHASVLGLARQLGTTWRTVWRSIEPLLQEMAADPARFDDVTSLGVDEHVWHHVDERKRGPKALTGMVDLSRDQAGRVRARLLDLVPGRSGKAYADWLDERGDAFRRRVQVATLDPFHGYKNAIDDQLEDATSVLDAFHVVKLGTQVVDDVRRRVQNPGSGGLLRFRSEVDQQPKAAQEAQFHVLHPDVQLSPGGWVLQVGESALRVRRTDTGPRLPDQLVGSAEGVGNAWTTPDGERAAGHRGPVRRWAGVGQGCPSTPGPCPVRRSPRAGRTWCG